MRTIQAKDITENVARLCIEANYFLGDDVIKSITEAKDKEKSATGREILGQIMQNAQIAKDEEVPICQDTGFTVVYAEVGQDLHIVDGYLNDAINAGVRSGYQSGYLRKSIVDHPLQRNNTGDNTPAIIHTTIVPGDKLKLTIAPKGGGSENMSALKMLKPAAGVKGVKDFVLQVVRDAGSNPCPPIVVGIGIGGTFEKSAMLAKEALIRPIGQRNQLSDIAQLEAELLAQINCLGIGPQGLGGTTTALDVHIEIYPAHIASLPVAVNINCHATRHKSIVL